MLSRRPIHTEISEMPALPIGRFAVASNEYFWHGNGVIRGRGAEERLWFGPYLQRLIIEVTRKGPSSRKEMQQILDDLEADDTVANTPLDGPAAYPGGGDALHPSHFRVEASKGSHVFTQEPK